MPPRFTRVFRVPYLPHDGQPAAYELSTAYERQGVLRDHQFFVGASTQTDTRLSGAEMRGPRGTFIEWKITIVVDNGWSSLSRFRAYLEN